MSNARLVVDMNHSFFIIDNGRNIEFDNCSGKDLMVVIIVTKETIKVQVIDRHTYYNQKRKEK